MPLLRPLSKLCSECNLIPNIGHRKLDSAPQASKPGSLVLMIGVPDKEIVPIIYQSQCGDVCVGSGINVTPCEPFHGNGTTTHGLDYTPFCSDTASITLLSCQWSYTSWQPRHSVRDWPPQESPTAYRGVRDGTDIQPGLCFEGSEEEHEGSRPKTARLPAEVVCPHIAVQGNTSGKRQQRPSYVEAIRWGMATWGYRGHFRAAKAMDMSQGRENGRPVLMGGSMVGCGGVIHGWNLPGARKALWKQRFIWQTKR